MNQIKENASFVKKYLDENELNYETAERDNLTAFCGEFGGFSGLYSSYRFVLTVYDTSVRCHVLYPATIKSRMPEMAECVLRANHGLPQGSFDLDCDDGTLLFGICFPMCAVRAERDETLQMTLGLPVITMDRYAKAFAEVQMGVKTPKEAILDIEK